ncbi:MAG: sensor histidine kinase, partial [Gaiellaceae bacterium]
MAKQGSKPHARGWRKRGKQGKGADVAGSALASDEPAAILDALVSSMQSGLLFEDVGGTISWVNHVVLRDLRVTEGPDALKGSDMREIDEAFRAYAIDPDHVLERADRLRDRGSAERAETILFVDGRVFERDYAPLVTDGEVTGHLWNFRDVTDRVQATRELERQNENLKQLDQAKDEFVALVSHELRTPLTSIIGYLEIGFPDTEALPETQQEALDVVGRNADRLLRLVNDLLFIAQLDAGRLSIQPGTVDLAEIVTESIEGQRARASAKSVALLADASGAARVNGDAERLAQLVDNLIANAIKFTPGGGAVTVRLRNHIDDVVFEVRDTGIGIPADEQGRLFDRFFRATSATRRNIPGTGLGLAIVRAIVDAHSGTVEVKSDEGVGSTFRVTLPTAAGGSSFDLPEWEDDGPVDERLARIVKGAG